MASTIATFGFALKEYYDTDTVENLVKAERPFLAKLNGNTKFQGDPMPVPLIYQLPQGVSGDFTSARDNGTSVGGKKFEYRTGDFFGHVDIGAKAMKLSRGNMGAFLTNKQAEIDGLYETMADDLSICAFRGNGGIPIGRRASISTNTVTLTEPEDIVNFEIGMVITASANTGALVAHTLRSGESAIVSIDREAGTFTLASAAAITSFADNDYLFRDGNFAGSTARTIFHGLDSFIYPSSTSVPDLYGMVRSDDPIRLAGCRVAAADIASASIEERLQILVSRMTGRYKAKNPDVAFANPEDWNRLQLSLQQRGQQSMTDDTAKFGFEYLQFTAGGAKVKVYADRHCPKGTVFVLKMKHWTMYSIDELIHVRNDDGLTILRKTDSNDYRYEAEAYPCLTNNAPLYNGRVTV